MSLKCSVSLFSCKPIEIYINTWPTTRITKDEYRKSISKFFDFCILYLVLLLRQEITDVTRVTQSNFLRASARRWAIFVERFRGFLL